MKCNSNYPKPSRYLMVDGQWYVLKSHVADQIALVERRAFDDGVIAGVDGAADQPAVEAVPS